MLQPPPFQSIVFFPKDQKRTNNQLGPKFPTRTSLYEPPDPNSRPETPRFVELFTPFIVNR